MRDLIARFFEFVGAVFGPTRPGRHSAAYLNAPVIEPAVNPWSRPWTGPSSAQVRAIFRPDDDEATLQLSMVQRERRYAAAFALIGVDYDYPGAPFPARAVAGLRVSA